MKKRLAMVIDSSGCIDCKACQAACKVANQVSQGEWRNWIKTYNLSDKAAQRQRTVFQPGNCMQCEKPSCITACPTGATYKSEKDGVVVINRDLCIGCGQCIKACPYGARYRHKTLKVADKCDFCAERRADGLEPACVTTCPNKTRVFGDINDPGSEVARLLQSKKTVQVVNAETNTDPNIFYIGEPGPKAWTKKAEQPMAFSFWRWVAGPAVAAFVGLNALGALAMAGKQVMMPKDAPEDEADKGGEK